ncbi:hypothetical protein [Parafrankia discariae]|uniref:hypothetical protein n=1 Tax=Parafrankia discariae TaxID=365528 RepID=UPI00035EDABB|nr:hypothetical protein [Parafrankia discariae]
MSSPDPSFGSLTLSDLANRADIAYNEHLATYTASTVLYRIHIEVSAEAETALDLEFLDVLDTVQERVEKFRESTRAHWRNTYTVWANAAGVEIPPDSFGSVE